MQTRLLGALCALTVLAAGCGPEASPESQPEPVDAKKSPVVYGTDNRQDV